MRMATGSVLAYQNADDEYAEKCFKTVGQLFSLNQTDQIVVGGIQVIDDKNNVTRTVPALPFDLRSMLLGFCHLPSQATFVGKDAFARALPLLLKLDLSRYELGMERVLFGLCAALASRCVIVREPLGLFRVHPGAKTFRLNEDASAAACWERAVRECDEVMSLFESFGMVRPMGYGSAMSAAARKAFQLARAGHGKELLRVVKRMRRWRELLPLTGLGRRSAALDHFRNIR
jgi:hypothetical protein